MRSAGGGVVQLVAMAASDVTDWPSVSTGATGSDLYGAAPAPAVSQR